MALESYRDLDVWQVSVDLTVETYRVTRRFPADERFGLTSQARRAASSIPSNIAEGYGRRGRAEYLHFLSIARGSLNELETLMIVAERLGLVKTEQLTAHRELTIRVSQLLTRLRRSLQ